MRFNEFLVERGQPEVYYFAYGMLTDPKNMRGAELIGSAELRNHKLEFHRYADIVDSYGNTVRGVLWSIPREMLSVLDQVEGVPSLYGRKQVPVFKDGKRYEAWVYQMTPNTREQLKDIRPTRNYLTTLARGYIKSDIPSKQIHNAVISTTSKN